MGRRAKGRRTVEEEAEAVGGGLGQPAQGYQSKLSEWRTVNNANLDACRLSGKRIVAGRKGRLR